MLKENLSKWNATRLKIVLAIFFFALAIPTAILINQAYSQLKWEAFHHYRTQAEELVTRIDDRYIALINKESARSFTDYSFLNITGNIKSRALQRSPLSNYPIETNFPGIIGYFQIDNNGKLSTPLLPSSEQRLLRKDFGISQTEKRQRLDLQNKIYQILSQNKLVSMPSVTTKNKTDEEILPSQIAETKISQNAPQAAFDQLRSKPSYQDEQLSSISSAVQGRVADLKLKKQYSKKSEESSRKSLSAQKIKRKQTKKKMRSRRESNVLPDYPEKEMKSLTIQQTHTIPVNMFESEIDAFEFSLLESGHFVLYRTVWKNKSRYIQGLLIKPSDFIKEITSDSFYNTNVSHASDLTIAYQGNIISTYNRNSDQRASKSTNDDLQGDLLLQNKLSSTLDKIELIFSINQLPAGPGSTIISLLSITLLLILSGGFFVLYILGLKQINLARQQQDFVSAVSHELKTPLTSIRMYGEILREGWTTEEKRKQYYDFIYEESERLTRLINNVLQLARMNRNEMSVDLKTYTIGELIDNTQSKIHSQVERAGFELNINCNDSIKEDKILADADFFIQVIINLVDNAIKFTSTSPIKQIDISCEAQQKNKVKINIRDYGPGIDKSQAKKIFKLFYRSENELTRETVGTGIGLSLVKQLVSSMQGEIAVTNKEPGAEFNIIFKTI